jgi:hypothetical protein
MSVRSLSSSRVLISRAFWLFGLCLLAFSRASTATAQVDIVFEKAGYHGDAFARDGEQRGLLTAKTTPTGGITGTFRIPGRTIPFRGQFSSTGAFSQTFVPRGDFAAATLELTMSGNTLDLGGLFIITGGTTFEITARRDKIGTSRQPVEENGYYTGLTSNSLGDYPSSPLCITVKPAGAIRLTCRLSNGTPIAAGSHVSYASSFPILTLLPRKRGFIAGTADFDLVEEGLYGSDFVRVTKIDDPEDPEAINVDDLEISGSRYVPPVRGARILDDFDPYDGEAYAQAFFDDEVGDVSLPFTWTTGNAAIFAAPNENKARLKFHPKTGLFSGQFINIDGRVTKIYGVCIQNPEEDLDYATGFFVNVTNGISSQIYILTPGDIL